jgi:hypothetical protein
MMKVLLWASLAIIAFFAIYLFFFTRASAKNRGAATNLSIRDATFTAGSDGQRQINGSVVNGNSQNIANMDLQFKIFDGEGAEEGIASVPISNLPANSSAKFSVPVDRSVEGFSFLNGQLR